MNTTLSAWIDGIGLLAPGLPNWPAAAVVLRGDAPCVDAPTELPPPAILPPAERRRASRIVKLALAAGVEAVTMAGADAAQLATVFSASCGDGHNCRALCEQLASLRTRRVGARVHARDQTRGVLSRGAVSLL